MHSNAPPSPHASAAPEGRDLSVYPRLPDGYVRRLVHLDCGHRQTRLRHLSGVFPYGQPSQNQERTDSHERQILIKSLACGVQITGSEGLINPHTNLRKFAGRHRTYSATTQLLIKIKSVHSSEYRQPAFGLLQHLGNLQSCWRGLNLHVSDVLEFLGQTGEQDSRHIHTACERCVLDHDRDRHGFGNGGKIIVQPLAVRLGHVRGSTMSASAPCFSARLLS